MHKLCFVHLYNGFVNDRCFIINSKLAFLESKHTFPLLLFGVIAAFGNIMCNSNTNKIRHLRVKTYSHSMVAGGLPETS